MLNSERQADLEAVFEYMFDGETEDFFEHLQSEEYIVDDGILTEEEVEDGLEDGERRYEIAEKAARDEKTNHIYANLFRLHEDFVKFREKK